MVLSHLGDIPDEDNPTSLTFIAQTTGVDVVLDGHSHSVIPDTLIMNATGNPVQLSSTGTEFQHIGLLSIGTDGKVSTRLIPTEGQEGNTEIQTYVDEIKDKADAVYMLGDMFDFWFEYRLVVPRDFENASRSCPRLV